MNTHRRICLILGALMLCSQLFFNTQVIQALPKTQLKSKPVVKKAVKPAANTFTLIVSSGVKGCVKGEGKILVKKILKLVNKKDALAFLKENSEVVESGGFISYINGLKSSYPVPSSKMTEELKAKNVLGVDWFVYLNGKKTVVGAGQIYPKKGDVIMFDYHFWNKDEFDPNNN